MDTMASLRIWHSGYSTWCPVWCPLFISTGSRTLYHRASSCSSASRTATAESTPEIGYTFLSGGQSSPAPQTLGRAIGSVAEIQHASFSRESEDRDETDRGSNRLWSSRTPPGAAIWTERRRHPQYQRVRYLKMLCAKIYDSCRLSPARSRRRSDGPRSKKSPSTWASVGTPSIGGSSARPCPHTASVGSGSSSYPRSILGFVFRACNLNRQLRRMDMPNGRPR